MHVMAPEHVGVHDTESTGSTMQSSRTVSKERIYNKEI